MNDENKILKTTEINECFVNDVCSIVEEGRRQAYNAVNSAMIETIGRWGNESWKKSNAELNEQNMANI